MFGFETYVVVVAAIAYFAGGFVKGAVGFALPLVAVTGAASVLPAQVAVALIILPVLVANTWQAFSTGVGPLLATLRRFWPMNLVLVVVIWFSAGLLPLIDDHLFFAGLGVMVAFFAGLQLAGWRPPHPGRHERAVGLGVGAFGGFTGGLAGIWGPPVVLYLLALRVDKLEQIRATGLCFMLGSYVLVVAHSQTGVLNEQTAAFSAAAILPTLIGQWIGQKAQRRLDQELFRKITLIVLCVSALNLLRRAFFG